MDNRFLQLSLQVGIQIYLYLFHSILFTILQNKDRVTGHNPAAALYTANSYYRKKLMPEGEQSK